ncbi:DegV domain-containing protein YitS [Mesobacillus campisalis]|uniref:DegV domain-containing protein YitS n=1 Tax=Mesobacillus campisalis TaxID=1408103 RepID=A0A0M2SS01_9BACI|nr:DegV family protein [Mesobacillus campisalis]KKK36928.1 DegV domain-containing protein YitS [Mesobacillus campisalis]
MGVKILADSASDLPLEFFEQNDVTLFPLKVHIDGKEYEDLRTIQPQEVYDKIRSGNLPKTSQASPAGFKEAFTEMAVNKEQGIYIAFSSQLSGTYQTAVMISEQVKEEYPDFDLSIIDTKCASLGCGLVVMEAVKAAQAGKSKEEIVNDAVFMAQHMEHLFSVDDLDHLAKGGRVSRASAFLGGLLNIKPLLNVEDGKLVPLEKIRGRKKLLRRIIELVHERGTSLDSQMVAISHADDETTALEMKELIAKEFGTPEIFISPIGAAIGSHTGPGTISIFFLNELP